MELKINKLSESEKILYVLNILAKTSDNQDKKNKLFNLMDKLEKRLGVSIREENN